MSERDEIKRSLYESVATGHIEIAGEQNGEHTFTITPEGLAHVEELLDGYLSQLVKYVSQDLGVPDFIARDLLFDRAATLASNTESGP